MDNVCTLLAIIVTVVSILAGLAAGFFIIQYINDWFSTRKEARDPNIIRHDIYLHPSRYIIMLADSRDLKKGKTYQCLTISSGSVTFVGSPNRHWKSELAGKIACYEVPEPRRKRRDPCFSR